MDRFPTPGLFLGQDTGLARASLESGRRCSGPWGCGTRTTATVASGITEPACDLTLESL
jgi:hypothetical protein